MHNHDNNHGHDSKMMWLMILPCLIVLITVLFISGKGIGSAANWQWIFSIAAMIGAHVLMMKFMHGHGESGSGNKEEK